MLPEQASFEEGYVNDADPSVLRFLIASREEVSAQQLRDDLLSMLVAGHETTGSVLTWTLYLLEANPSAMAKVGPRCLPSSGVPGQAWACQLSCLHFLHARPAMEPVEARWGCAQEESEWGMVWWQKA